MEIIIVFVPKKVGYDVLTAQRNVLSYLGSRIATLIDEDNEFSPIQLNKPFSMTEEDFKEITRRCNEADCVPLIVSNPKEYAEQYESIGDGLVVTVVKPPFKTQAK